MNQITTLLIICASALAYYSGSRLDQILDAKVLRVGTTGDYAPFSYAGDSSADLRESAHELDLVSGEAGFDKDDVHATCLSLLEPNAL